MNAVLPESNQDLMIHAPSLACPATGIRARGPRLKGEGLPSWEPPLAVADASASFPGGGGALWAAGAPAVRPQWLICCSAARVADSYGAPGEQDRQPRPPSEGQGHWIQARLPLSIFRGKCSGLRPPWAPQGVWPSVASTHQMPWRPPRGAECPEAGRVILAVTSDGDALYLPPQVSPAEALGQGRLLPQTPDCPPTRTPAPPGRKEPHPLSALTMSGKKASA